jgi:hypothetical protein
MRQKWAGLEWECPARARGDEGAPLKETQVLRAVSAAHWGSHRGSLGQSPRLTGAVTVAHWRPSHTAAHWRPALRETHRSANQ